MLYATGRWTRKSCVHSPNMQQTVARSLPDVACGIIISGNALNLPVKFDSNKELDFLCHA